MTPNPSAKTANPFLVLSKQIDLGVTIRLTPGGWWSGLVRLLWSPFGLTRWPAPLVRATELVRYRAEISSIRSMGNRARSRISLGISILGNNRAMQSRTF